MPTKTVGGLEMYYELSGSGAAVVFISGVTQDHVPWKVFQVPAFSGAGYQCLVFDNRDVGQTGESPLGSYPVARFAQDTVELTEQLGIRSFHLVGYSMGGMIAQELALAFPGRIRTLTLLATAPKVDAYVATLFATLKAAKLKLSLEEFLRTIGLRVFTHRFYENPDNVQKWMSRALANPYPQSAASFVRQADAILGHNTMDRLHGIAIPTHVVVGEEDIFVFPRFSQSLAATIPAAKLTVIPEAGHAVAAERATEFNRIALEFLAMH